MKNLIAILIGVAAAGCQSGFNRDQMNTRLQDEKPLVFDDMDVLRIEQTRPQLQFPIRLAVVPPSMFNESRWDMPGESEGQRKEIQVWGEKLRDAGIVSELILLPEILIADSRSLGTIRSVRLAAARVQADAVLILRSTCDVDSYINPLGVLDLTIVGMFLIPGHHKDALTIVEGMVIDNRNQYVYFAGTAEGTGSTFGPLAAVDAKDAVRDSRCAALKSFGDLLLREGRRMREWVPGPQYSTPGQR